MHVCPCIIQPENCTGWELILLSKFPSNNCKVTLDKMKIFEVLVRSQSPGEIKRREMELDHQDSPGEIKRREVELDPQDSPGEIKSREVELVPQKSLGEIKRREVELDPQDSPGEIKSREVELDPQDSLGEIKRSEVKLVSHRKLDNPLLHLVLNSCSVDTVFETLFRTAAETAVSEVHKLLGTGGVPTSLTLLFWRWLTVSSVFAGRSV